MRQRPSSLFLALPLLLALSGCDSINKAFEYASSEGREKSANAEQKPAHRNGAGQADANQAQAAGQARAADPSVPAEITYAGKDAKPARGGSAGMGAPAATKPFAFEAGKTGNSHCGFDGLSLPSNTKVYAAGAYGGRKLNFQIDESGHEATQIDVAVNEPDAPVVLMLGGYEPTVWTIGWSKRTQILAVLVSGYHRQVVSGLPASTPMLISTYDNKGPCGSFHVSQDEAEKLNPIARRVFERAVDKVYIAQQGRVLIGADAGSWVTDRAAPSPESFRLPNSQLAGPAGLEQAVRMGNLREASQRDADAWIAAQSTRPRDVPTIVGASPRSMDLYNAYVVIRPFRLPAGLYGAHSATFFVPKGVARPTGELGHSTLYDFNTVSCAGTRCNRE